MRLIDADALELDAEYDDGEYWAYSKTQIENALTIEPKKGKWIHGMELSREMIGDVVTAIFYEGWECSECHCLVSEEREPLWNFCPNCGADMRKGEVDG